MLLVLLLHLIPVTSDLWSRTGVGWALGSFLKLPDVSHVQYMLQFFVLWRFSDSWMTLCVCVFLYSNEWLTSNDKGLGFIASRVSRNDTFMLMLWTLWSIVGQLVTFVTQLAESSDAIIRGERAVCGPDWSTTLSLIGTVLQNSG
jgi:hypothetical protein